MNDIIICILPKIQPDAPTVGPAVLKSHCEANGFSASVVDLNIDIFHHLGKDYEHHWFAADQVWYKLDKWLEFYPTIESRVEYWAKELLSKKAKYIGLSIFSNYSALFAKFLGRKIKELCPEQKIIIGGAGTFNMEIGSDSSIKRQIADYADHIVKGDGEDSLISLLKGNLDHPGIDSGSHQVLDLDTILYPNYSDINWNDYSIEQSPERIAYITGSRGCVRNCTFCDVAAMWPKYRFRSGKHIAGEIIEVRKNNDIEAFEFTDSLVNGSMKAFRDMCKTLADYRKETGDKDWSWQSQFIARSKTQMPPEDFTLMKRGGANMVSIGIESASEAVRNHMQKGFTNEDMWYTFEQLKANNVKIGIMMLVGYPTETKEDFQETLSMLDKLNERGFFEINPINGFKYMRRISFGPTMQLYSGTPITAMAHDIGIRDDATDNWVYKNNNIRVRIVRLLQAYAKLEQLNYDEKWWMIKRRNKNLMDEYENITGKKLPENILEYNEEEEYDCVSVELI